MKRRQNASLAFKRKNVADKVLFGTTVIGSITKNAASFPNLPIPIAGLQDRNDALNKARVAANSGNHVSMADMQAAIADWNDGFAQTAIYVSSVANGAEVMILKAGFVPTKGESNPVQVPEMPADYTATVNGSRGAVTAGTKKMAANSISSMLLAVPEGVDMSFDGNAWVIKIADKIIQVASFTGSKTALYGLPSGVRYTLAMCAINAAGSSAASMQQVIPQ